MKPRTLGTYNGWTVEFQENIHMYAHHLKLSKDGQILVVQCEDTPDGWVGIWPFDLKEKISATIFQDLLTALRRWARQTGMNYRLYKSRGEFETKHSPD